VCEPDPELERVATAPVASSSRRRGGRARGAHPAQAGLAATRHDPEEAVDEDDFERLRAWRWERAEGKPAYTVAANAVLEEVLRRRPASTQKLIEIRGVGPSFVEKHGESLLTAVRELDQADTALASGSAPT
jgi:superfamily II DNA helicase RecQ